eukprot:692795_1
MNINSLSHWCAFKTVFLWIILMNQMKNVSSKSVCDEVDAIFVVHSDVIIQDGNDESTKMQDFIEDVIYFASSEKSGVGFIVYDHLPSSMDADSTNDIKLLGLSETKGLSVIKTSRAVESALKFSSFFSEDIASNDNVATLSTALASAREVFRTESTVDEDVIFIMAFDHSTKDICIDYYNSEEHDRDIEQLYFVEVELNIDGDIEVDAVYDCHRGGFQSDEYEAFAKLMEITCPANVDLGESGHAAMNKLDNYLDPNSVLSCDLKFEEIAVNQKSEFVHRAGTNKNQEEDWLTKVDTMRILVDESIILVDDVIDDEMSFEKGYILLVKNREDAAALDAKGCTITAFKIVKVTEISSTASSTILQLNVVGENAAKYISTGHIRYHQDTYTSLEESTGTNRRMLSVDLINIQTWWTPIVGTYDIRAGQKISDRLSMHGEGTLDLKGYHQFGLRIGVQFELDIDWCFLFPCDIEYFLFAVYGGFDFDFELNTTFTGKLFTLYELFEKKGHEKTIWIGFIPIILEPKLALGLKTILTSPYTTLKHSFGVHFHPFYKVGVEFDGSKWNTIDEYREDYSYHNDFSFESPEHVQEMCPSGTVTIGLELKLGATLYYTLFVYVVLFPAIKADVALPSKCGIQYGELECTAGYIPRYIEINPALVISVGIGMDVECNFLMDLFGLCGYSVTFWIIDEALIYQFPQICLSNINGLGVPIIPIPLPHCCQTQSCYNDYPSCKPKCVSGPNTKIWEIYRSDDVCYQVTQTSSTTYLDSPTKDPAYFKTLPCEDGCPTFAPTMSPTDAPCFYEIDLAMFTIEELCAMTLIVGYNYKFDDTCFQLLRPIFCDIPALRYPRPHGNIWFEWNSCDDICHATSWISALDTNVQMSGDDQYYECPNGYIVAGFEKDTCQSISCLDNMRCVSPAKPAMSWHDCYEHDWLDGAESVQCKPGYFVNAIYHSAGDPGLSSWRKFKCCTYDSHQLVADEDDKTKDWSDCFSDGVTRHWCLVGEKDFIVGFGRGDKSQTVDDLREVITRNIWWTLGNEGPEPTPHPVVPTRRPTTYLEYLQLKRYHGIPFVEPTPRPTPRPITPQPTPRPIAPQPTPKPTPKPTHKPLSPYMAREMDKNPYISGYFGFGALEKPLNLLSNDDYKQTNSNDNDNAEEPKASPLTAGGETSKPAESVSSHKVFLLGAVIGVLLVANIVFMIYNWIAKTRRKEKRTYQQVPFESEYSETENEIE